MKTRFWQKLWTVVLCKGACSLTTFSMEKPGLGCALQTFPTHREGRRELERNMDLLIWLTRELSDWSEDLVRNPLVYHWLCRAIVNWSVCVYQGTYNSCIPIWKKRNRQVTANANFQLRKSSLVSIQLLAVFCVVTEFEFSSETVNSHMETRMKFLQRQVTTLNDSQRLGHRDRLEVYLSDHERPWKTANDPVILFVLYGNKQNTFGYRQRPWKTANDWQWLSLEPKVAI